MARASVRVGLDQWFAWSRRSQPRVFEAHRLRGRVVIEEFVDDWFEAVAKVYDLVDYRGRFHFVEPDWWAVELVFSGHLTIAIGGPDVGSEPFDRGWWSIDDLFVDVDPNGNVVPGEDAHVGIPHVVGGESEGNPLEPSAGVAEGSGCRMRIIDVVFSEVGCNPREVASEPSRNAIGHCSPEFLVDSAHGG